MRFLQKFHYNSPVILTFALICLFSYWLNRVTDGWANAHLFSTYRASLTNPMMYLRLFGHILGHVSWAHFMNNILMILLLGPMLEEKYGSKTLIEMIVITAVVTGIAHNLLQPHAALLGASGIVYMLIVLSSIASMKDNRIPITFLLISIIYIGGEIIDGFQKDNISHMTHIIGGVCGGFYGMVLRGKKG